jgi:hypothetical protein
VAQGEKGVGQMLDVRCWMLVAAVVSGAIGGARQLLAVTMGERACPSEAELADSGSMFQGDYSTFSGCSFPN